MSDATTPMPDSAPTSSMPSASNDTVLAAVATIPLIGLIIYYAMPDAGDLVKFYAKQSIGLLILSIAVSIVSFVVGLIPFLGWVISFFISLLGLVVFILWLVLLVNALQGNKYRLPYLADFTDQLIK